jgi:phosphopantothenoylcysteine decarboxylase/phosphopantothenate--cysteine ligase
MPTPLEGRHVALGVTGSIAAYKAVDLASRLVQAGSHVAVMLTDEAARFVSPLSFAAIVHRPVVTDLYDPRSEMGMDHVALAEQADLVMVAPATANTLAKMAHGLADDPVTTTVLATGAPVIVAPAMDARMFENPATRANLAALKDRGLHVAGPASGRMASGLEGVGRMVEPEELVGHARLVLGRAGDMAGRRLVVTAGGTEEPIDPVRVITNRSSGKMGFAVAEAARDRGADVTLIAARSTQPGPVGVSVVRAASARAMADAVREAAGQADAVVMAAAVSDWTPAAPSAAKLKKGAAGGLTLELERTEDVIGSVERPGLVKVGFALETEDLERNARAKLAAKGLDLIVANDAVQEDAGMGADENRVTMIGRDGEAQQVPTMSKYEVGHRILDRVVGLLAGRGGSSAGELIEHG